MPEYILVDRHVYERRDGASWQWYCTHAAWPYSNPARAGHVAIPDPPPSRDQRWNVAGTIESVTDGCLSVGVGFPMLARETIDETRRAALAIGEGLIEQKYGVFVWLEPPMIERLDVEG